MSKFQIVLTALFVLFIIVGVALFATYKKNSSTDLPTITIWGTVSANTFNSFLNQYNATLQTPLRITYEEKKEDTFDQDFIETLASGASPDAILVSQDLIFKENDKLYTLPYTVFDQRTFKNTFVQEGELFLTAQGVLALPFSIDPLVMYWNRDTFTNAGIASYPKSWSELPTLAQTLTKKQSSTVISSAVAFGEAANVTHARELLGTLIMQAGDPIVAYDTQGALAVTLGSQPTNAAKSPAALALSFFTDFSNPVNPQYSWNRSLPQSKNFFISGDLALYFGFASEAGDIRTKNPNLNYDIAPMPQLTGAKTRLTYGKMYAFAIPKLSKNPNTAFQVETSLLSSAALSMWTSLTNLPPVRRDMIAAGTTDPYLSIFYDGALISRSWIDFDTTRTASLFQTMVESVTSSKEDINQALRDTQDSMSRYIK